VSPHRILPRGGSSPLLRGSKPSTDGLAGKGPRCQGGFPRGTHSVRPQIRAGCKPGHLISTTCVKDDPGTLWGHVSVRPKPSLRACRARPSRGGKPSTDGLTEEGPETTREAVFSEGRTPCVRKYEPDASPDISFPPHASKMTRGPCEDMCRLGPSHPCGRAEPAPPGVDSPSSDGLAGKTLA